MKFKLLLLVGFVCLVAVCNARPADEEYAEYEDEPAPPPPPKPTRPNPLKNRRNPLAGRSNNKATSTTTPAPAKVEESEFEEEPLEEVGEQTSSTTEVPKKFKAGSVRPFRSNDDLLAALKRRREQAAHHKPAAKVVHQDEEPAAAEATPAPSKNRASANNGRKRFNHNKAAEPQVNEEATSAPARTGRRFSSRN